MVDFPFCTMHNLWRHSSTYTVNNSRTGEKSKMHVKSVLPYFKCSSKYNNKKPGWIFVSCAL